MNDAYSRMNHPIGRALQLASLLVVILLAGVLGYHYIERWSLFDSLFMTVITLATVGYGETHPLTHGGRLFTIFLILGGMSIIFYTLTEITTFVVEGEMTGILRRRRMNREIKKLKNHYILCGAGKSGEHALHELLKTRQNCVVIERDPEKISRLLREGVLVVEGDATEDQILMSAGINQAAGLISTLPDDKENLFVVITARGLNPALRIIAKVEEISSRDKFLRSGADKAVSANFIGGLRMASEMIRPATVTFLDSMLRGNSTLRVEEVTIGASSKYLGTTIAKCDPLHSSGVVLLSIRQAGADDFQFNPAPDTQLRSGDTIIVVGDQRQVKKLREDLNA